MIQKKRENPAFFTRWQKKREYNSNYNLYRLIALLSQSIGGGGRQMLFLIFFLILLRGGGVEKGMGSIHCLKSLKWHSLLILCLQTCLQTRLQTHPPELILDNSGWYVCRRVCRRVWRHVIRRFQIALKSPRGF